MSKEMPILFIYDTLHCQTEHDDPSEAVLYFYPNWVSDQQRLSLCGQLMGTTYFLKNVFSCPKIIELKSGKFVMKHFGRYVLAVGTDRNIANWILLHRADLLSSLFQFYHCDIQIIKYQNEVSVQSTPDTFSKSKLSDKLYQIFESYLPILQHGSNIFQNVPIIRLPKSGSNIFLEAMHTLQFCQFHSNVLGGTILYHNKVVATQLPSNITKYLVLTDPHHIKSSAEKVDVTFHLPAETQVLIVYIERDEYNFLKNLSDKAKNLIQNKQSILNKTPSSKDVTIKSSLKRDKSIIFTTVPEEDIDQNSCLKLDNFVERQNISESKSTQKFNQKFSRPTHLPLKYKNVTSRDLPDSGLGIDKTDEDEMIPEFKGQTSVCSTPMTDLNKILHGRAMSICSEIENKHKEDLNLKKSHNLINEENDQNKLKILQEGFLNLNKYRRNSLPDLRKDRSSHKGFPMRTYAFGLSKFKFNDDEEDCAASFLKRNRTLSEPSYNISTTDFLIENQFERFNFDSKKIISDNLNREMLPIVKSKELEPTFKETTVFDRSKMSLPLKSNTPVGPIPLTPLMSKLSILSTLQDSLCDYTPEMQERSICNTPVVSIINSDTSNSETFYGKKRVHLLICGQRDMTLLLILEDGAGLNAQFIMEMWETCVNRLPRIESRLRDILGAVEPEQIPSNNEHGYSFMYLDSHWDVINRGGPWDPQELSALGHMHSDLVSQKDISEIILRCDEGVLFGYQCGSNEMYYQQAAEKRSGIPPPSDGMGSVQIRARRRLERDHAIILL